MRDVATDPHYVQASMAELWEARLAEMERAKARLGLESDPDFVTCSSCGQLAGYGQRNHSHIVRGLHCGIYC